jgi:signal peptidase I
MRHQADSASALARAASTLVQEHLEAGRTVRLTIPTASMWPTLSPGDAVLVRGAQPGEPRVGDIVVGKWGEGWRAHRLIDRRRNAGQTLLVTQGDNSAVADDAWPESQLVGVVVAIRHGQREVDLQSARARQAGAALAFLLRRQSAAQRTPGLVIRWAVLKGWRSLIRASVWLALGVS